MWYIHRVNSQPKLGIVIAAYNAERFLMKTLEAIRDTTHRNFECVVVNDGSTDSTYTIADSFATADDRFTVVTITNSGPCIARNIGFDYLGEEVSYIVFTDADDVIFPDTYSRFIDNLEHDQECIAVHGLGTFIDEHDQVDKSGTFERIGLARKKLHIGRIVDLGTDQPTSFESLVLSSTVFPPGLVVHRKEILDKAGLFDTESRYAEDWDLLLRVTRFGHMSFVPEPVLYYRRHQNNVGTSPRVPVACKKVWTKAYYSKENSASHREFLKSAFRAKNISELQLYVNNVIGPKRDQNRPRAMRGILGSLVRLIQCKPQR